MTQAAPAPDPSRIVHPHPFDPTYGCDPAALAAIRAPETDPGFAAFWRGTRAEADRVPLRLERQALPAPAPGWRLSLVRFDSLGGFRIGAWLLEPEATCRAGLVVGHGYGGRESPPTIEAAFPQPEPIALLAPCMPGFHLSACAAAPGDGHSHVVVGIAKPETYIIRFCVAAMWAATRALAELRPDAARRLGYEGGSFGGGLGALAAPWEPAWRAVRLDVPTFGHHPWRLKCPCVGSGEAVRKRFAADPSIMPTLRMHDAAVAATFARAPGFFVPAYFDPAVPPPGQWAVVNAWAGPKRIAAITSGHFEGPWSAADPARSHAGWSACLREHLLA